MEEALKKKLAAELLKKSVDDGFIVYITKVIDDLLEEQKMNCFQNLIQAKLPTGMMAVPEWGYNKMNQMQVRDYILKAPEPEGKKL